MLNTFLKGNGQESKIRINKLDRILSITEEYKIEVCSEVEKSIIFVGEGHKTEKCIVCIEEGKIFFRSGSNYNGTYTSFKDERAGWLKLIIENIDSILNSLLENAKEEVYRKLMYKDFELEGEEVVGRIVKLRFPSDYGELMAGVVGTIKSHNEDMYEFSNGYDSHKIVSREEFIIMEE